MFQHDYTTVEHAREYTRRGWCVVPVPLGEKAPRVRGWQQLRLTEVDLPAYFDNRPTNIGVLLGEPSGNLVDVDLDCAEAVALASELLPRTGCVFGRASKRASHWLYRCRALPRTRPWKDVDGAVLVELRSTGAQTIVPPSTHPSGEAVTWERDDEPATVEPDDLLRAVGRLAAAALLARHWPQRGSRHEAALALAGALARAGWTPDEVAWFVGAVARAAGDEEWQTDRVRASLSTCETLAQGDPVTGLPTLANLVSREVVDLVVEWLGLEGTQVPELHLTDLGNAERLIERHGKDLRYCWDLGRWLVWDGARFRLDTTGEVERRAKETARALYQEAAVLPGRQAREAAMDWARASESRYRIEAALHLARSERVVAVTASEFDQNPWLLNVQNGTVDLRTGELRPHRRDDMLTRLAPVEYDPTATAPRWEQFLREIFPDDEDAIRAVQRAVGYTLTGDTREQVFFFCHGTGANGKTTFLNTLRALLGEYAAWTPFGTFQHGGEARGHSDQLMDLEGKRLVVSAEKRTVGKLSEDVLKLLAGQEPVTGSRKYERTRTFQPVCKVWLAANTLPRVDDVTDGFWRKVVLVPFTRRFAEHEQDHSLAEKLRHELAGILAWAVRGCLEWQQSGLAVPATFREARDDWRSENDPLADFLDECPRVPGERVLVGKLFEAYQAWCAEHTMPQIIKTTRTFSQVVQAHGIEKTHTKHGKAFLDIGFPPDVERALEAGRVFGLGGGSDRW